MDLFFTCILSLVLVLVFFFLPLLFSVVGLSLGTSAPVESGFSGLSEDISFFNNHFFIVLVLFVLFDLEVVLSLCVLCGSSSFVWVLLFFMVVTLLLEWDFGKIQWGY